MTNPPDYSFADYLHRLAEYEMGLRPMPAKIENSEKSKSFPVLVFDKDGLPERIDLNPGRPPQTPLPPDPPPPDRPIPPPADDFTAAPLTLEEQDLLAEFDALRDMADEPDAGIPVLGDAGISRPSGDVGISQDVGISPAPAAAGPSPNRYRRVKDLPHLHFTPEFNAAVLKLGKAIRDHRPMSEFHKFPLPPKFRFRPAPELDPMSELPKFPPASTDPYQP